MPEQLLWEQPFITILKVLWKSMKMIPQKRGRVKVYGYWALNPQTFGWSAAITSNGTIIAVGVLRTGSVHFYEFKENNWQQRTFGGFITGNQFSFGYGRQFVFLL
jgi:hypothetical protein